MPKAIERIRRILPILERVLGAVSQPSSGSTPPGKPGTVTNAPEPVAGTTAPHPGVVTDGTGGPSPSKIAIIVAAGLKLLGLAGIAVDEELAGMISIAASLAFDLYVYWRKHQAHKAPPPAPESDPFAPGGPGWLAAGGKPIPAPGAHNVPPIGQSWADGIQNERRNGGQP